MSSLSSALKEKGALVALALCALMAALGSNMANVALPTLATAFGAPIQTAQWIVIAYLLAVTTFVVSAGSLSDRFGRRRLLLLGVGVFTFASIACAIAPTLPFLIAARALQGAGGAVMMALSLALVGQTVPTERLGRAMGVLGTMSAVGTALGPSLGGVFTSSIGWRSIFLLSVPLGLVTVTFIRAFLPRDHGLKQDQRQRFDVLGTLLLAVGLAAYSLSMTLGRKSFGPASVSLVLIALVAGGLFVLIESRVKTPLVPLDLLKEPVLRSGFISSLLVSTVLMATLVVGPFYLSGALQLSAAQVGLVLSVGPAMVALWGVPSGRLVDRIGARWLSGAGLIAIMLGCVLFSALPIAAGVVGYVLPLAMIASGYAVFQTSNNALVMAGAATERRGVLSGILNLSRNLGLVSGASMMGAVFTAFAKTPVLEAATRMEVSGGFRATFAVAALLIGVAVGFSVPRPARTAKTARAKAALV